MPKHTYTTQAQVRRAFWEHWGGRERKFPHGDYPAHVLVEFAEFVAMLARDGHISEALARRVTL